jgi:hypothetical protein
MLKKYKSYKLSEILLLAGIGAIIIFTLVYSYTANAKANKIYDSITTSTAIPGYVLKIDSDPAGVIVRAEKYCDSKTLDKQTPFSCSIPRSLKTITISAPDVFTKDGKKYTFQEWSGCSKETSDKTACKINLPLKDGIKANYSVTAATKITPLPPAYVAPQPTCNGVVINGGKTCRFVISYSADRMPGRLTAYMQQSDGAANFTAECSANDACTTYEQNPKPIIAPYTNSRIEFAINKPTDITIDVPMTLANSSGSGNSNFIFSKFDYTKATYANGGGGTFYDTLNAVYLFVYNNNTILR